MHTQQPLTQDEHKKLEAARKEVLVNGRSFFLAIAAFCVILLVFYRLPSIEQFQKNHISFIISVLFWVSPVVSAIVLYAMVIYFMAPFTSDINNKVKTIVSGTIERKYITRKSKILEGDVKVDNKKYSFFFVIDGESLPIDKEHFDQFTEGQYIAIHLAPESGFIFNIESDNQRFMNTSV